MIDRLQQWARELKRLVYALGLASRDPRTPWPARLVAAAVVGYAISPLDLIPDVIPVLGLLDDLVLIPLGVALAVRLIPAEVWCDALQAAEQGGGRLPGGKAGATVIVVLWLVAVILIALTLRRFV